MSSYIIELNKQIVKKLKELAPQAEVSSIPTIGHFRFFYYTVSVVRSQIVVVRQWRDIYTNDTPENLIKNRYLTENEAREAINKVRPRAIEKYNNCLKAFEELKRNLGFSVGFNYEGDSCGIYDEHYYIEFNMDGFDFNFEIGD